MKPKKLSLDDKKVFSRYLALSPHELSVYSFANIFIWRGLFDISWEIIDDNLCVFFRDKAGSFLYLPPLGAKFSLNAVSRSFEIMGEINSNSPVCRIENVEEEEAKLYQGKGFTSRPKGNEYLYLREDLVGLKGNKFKSQRAAFNYFVKNNAVEYADYKKSYHCECLGLYDLWQTQRKRKNADPLYQWMLEDSRNALSVALDNYTDLGLIGRVVKIGNLIKAFTFGFELNKNEFCVLYEITDISFKGLAQFVFRKFSEEMSGYKYINAMDDSGLANLKKVKLSYRPGKLIPAYIITKDDV